MDQVCPQRGPLPKPVRVALVELHPSDLVGLIRHDLMTLPNGEDDLRNGSYPAS